MKILCYFLLLYGLANSTLWAQVIQWELYQGKEEPAFPENYPFPHLHPSYKAPSNSPKGKGAQLAQPGNDPKLWDYQTIAVHSTGFRFFRFRNIGDAPLVISSVKSSCGCLIPSWPNAPILPNEVGYIQVIYNTARIGKFTKYLKVFTFEGETPVETKLRIKGEVLPKEEE